MKRVDDFRLNFGKQELVPIVIGGMGVDISTADLALEAARLGGIGHISDAMVKTVADRRYKTKFVKAKEYAKHPLQSQVWCRFPKRLKHQFCLVRPLDDPSIYPFCLDQNSFLQDQTSH